MNERYQSNIILKRKSNLKYIERTIDRLKNQYLEVGQVRTGKGQLKRLNEYANMI